MAATLDVLSAGPGVTIQDMGRPGNLAQGLSRGGAADRLALLEGGALLGQGSALAALEMAGMGASFTTSSPLRIALTGAPMRADIDGEALTWNASHLLPAGATLRIGAVTRGNYGYLHIGGGFDTEVMLGARSTHLAAGLGQPIAAGDHLPCGKDAGTETGFALTPEPRFDGGTIRVVPSLQTPFFDASTLTRFEESLFVRDTRGNRMGARFMPDGDGFATEAGLNILSEVIVPGDIQMTGDGTPYVLLAECGTTGGYPRIGSVIPADMPRIAQAAPGTEIRFTFITLDAAREIEAREAARRKTLRASLFPLIRNPADIPDLLSYQLIGGVTAGDDPEPGER